MDAMTVIDEWIDTAPEPSRPRLRELAWLVRSLVPPETGEKIGYGIPTWTLNGNLVHIAGHERHVSLHPGAVVERFADQLGDLVRSKGTIQFPLDRPLPTELITQVVEYRVAQQQAKPKGRA
jgi:uncharacterized protein YdhG (YjbR/CyaY superfamily)